MAKEKPTISKADRSHDIGDVWFSQSEIDRMTGQSNNKTSKAKKVKKGLNESRVSTSRITKKAFVFAKSLVTTAMRQLKSRRIRQTVFKNKALVLGSTMVLAISVLGILSMRTSSPNSSSETAILGEQVAVEPEFNVVVPEGASSEPIYEPDRMVYRYTTTYGGVSLAVTQQPAPADILSGALNLQQLALSIPNFESMGRYESESHGLVYVVKQTNGKQASVFVYNNELLVFINSDTRVGPEQILGFVDSL